jgi:hypothetical protein
MLKKVLGPKREKERRCQKKLENKELKEFTSP